MKMTNLVLHNLLGNANYFVISDIVLAFSTTLLGGTYLLNRDDYGGEVIEFTTTIGTGFSVLSAATDLPSEFISQLHDTQAYVESLNEEELTELINKLETKDFSSEIAGNEVVLTKKIGDKKDV